MFEFKNLFLILVLCGMSACSPFRSDSKNESSTETKVDTYQRAIKSVNETLRQVLKGKNISADEMRDLLSQRSELLSQLAELRADLVIPLGLPANELQVLRSRFPALSSDLEEWKTVQGNLETVMSCDLTRKTSRNLQYFRSAGLQKKIYAASERVRMAPTNPKATLLALAIKSGLVAYDQIISPTTLSAQAAVTPCTSVGEQRMLVIPILYAHTTPPRSVDFYRRVFFGGAGTLSLTQYWLEASRGKTWASGDVVDWVTLDQSYSCSEYSAAGREALQKLKGKVDFSKYQRVYFILPNPSSCGNGGLGMVGCGADPEYFGDQPVSYAWLADSLMNDEEWSVELLAHEAGHNIGLSHTGSAEFSGEPLGAVQPDTGTYNQYGDPFDAMGGWSIGNYSAAQKAQIGWYKEGVDYVTLQSSASVELSPLSSSAGGLKAMRVRRGIGNSSWLWIQYRQPMGFDKLYRNSSPNLYSGALIHYQRPNDPYLRLLDFTPGSAYGALDAALEVGHTFKDTYTGLEISIDSLNVDHMKVSVRFPENTTPAPTVMPTPSPGPGPGPTPAPTPTAAPNPAPNPNPAPPPGQTVRFSEILNRVAEKAGQRDGYNFYQWNWFYTNITGRTAPAPDGFVSDPTQSLTVEQWWNGIKAYVVTLPDVIATTPEARDYAFDQWNWFYAQLTGKEGPDPASVGYTGPRESPMAASTWWSYMVKAHLVMGD